MSSRRRSLSPASVLGSALLLLPALPLSGLTGGCSSSDSGDDDTGKGGNAGTSSNVGGSSTAGNNTGGSSSAKKSLPAGSLLVTLVADSDTTGHTTFDGQIRDKAPNQLTLWDLDQEAGGCQLFTPRVPFCETECPSGSACVDDDVCSPNAENHSVGTMTVKGLKTQAGDSEFTIEPMAPKFNYAVSGSTKLAYPPAAEGAEVTISTAGGDYEAFEVKSSGIVPLKVTAGDTIPLDEGKALSLSWEAKGSSGKSRIEVVVDISHHGGKKGEIVCDVEDNGSLEIPSSLVDRLIALGTAGFPTVKLSRVARGSTEISVGRVDFDLYSHVEKNLSIAGVISCNTNSECPDGQSCGATRKCE